MPAPGTSQASPGALCLMVVTGLPDVGRSTADLNSRAVSDERERLKAERRMHGDRLREAQAADEREHNEIAKLVPRALDAGISKREIARLAAVGRPWIDKTMRVPRQPD